MGLADARLFQNEGYNQITDVDASTDADALELLGVASPTHSSSLTGLAPDSAFLGPGAYASDGKQIPYSDEREKSNLVVNSAVNDSRENSRSRLSIFSGTRDVDDLAQPEYVKWGIGWRQPLAMVLFYLAGVLFCVGHHLYYNWHVGREAGDANAQFLKIAIGTGFTFLALFFLGSANGIAFTQYIWIVVKRHSLTVGGLDQLFGIPMDITAFFSLELLKKCKLVLLMAGVIWCMALSGVIPPGTLSVVNDLGNSTCLLTVPTFNYTKIPSDPLMLFQAFTHLNSTTRLAQPSPQIVRMAARVAQSADLIQIAAPAPNATYRTTFTAPGLRCNTANVHQQASFDIYNSHVLAQTNTWTVGRYLNSTFVGKNPPNFLQFYSAWSPQLYGYISDNLTPAGEIDHYGNWKAMGPSARDQNRFYGAEIWIQLSNQSVVCSLTNASYDINFQYTNNVPIVTQNSITHLNVMSGQLNPEYGGYLPYMAALGTILYGNMSTFSWPCNITQGAYVNELGHCYNLFSSSSKALLTALAACDEIQNSWWEQNASEMDMVHYTPSQPFAQNNTGYNECRNRTLMRAIEDLAANLTISMLSIPYGTLNNLTTPLQINATVNPTINVYDYDKVKLLASYGAAIVASMFMIIVGGVSFYINGVSHNASFSTIMTTTRSEDLDRISHGQSLGRPELCKDLERTKLRFGVADEIPVGNHRTARRLSFGLKGRVAMLKKGERYI